MYFATAITISTDTGTGMITCVEKYSSVSSILSPLFSHTHTHTL